MHYWRKAKQGVGVDKLVQWGRWVNSDSDMLGSYSSWLMIMRDNVQTSKGVRYSITDDDALTVDAAVTRLAAKNTLLWQIICLKYICNLGLRDIANALYKIDPAFNGGKKFNINTLNAKLNMAEGFIDGVLSAK